MRIAIVTVITTTIAISNPTATATVHATTIVAPLQCIITLPTTVTTTISIVTSADYQQLFYE